MIRHALALPLATFALSLWIATPAGAQETRRLTLDGAIELATENSAGVEAMRLRVMEMTERSSSAFTNYLPRVETNAGYLVTNNTQGILIPGGALGMVPGLGAFPPADTNIPQGGTDLFFTFTTLAQPLTHYFKIREGRGVALADVDAAEADLHRTRQEVSLGVLQLYAGLLLARRGIELSRARVDVAAMREIGRASCRERV